MSELEERLNQLYEQGVVEVTAKQRVKEVEILREELPKMKKDDQLIKSLKLFKALGNKNRLLILWLILKGVRCACEIEDLLNLSQSTVSHHINLLVDVGIISAIKKGKWQLVEVQETNLSEDFGEIVKQFI